MSKKSKQEIRDQLRILILEGANFRDAVDTAQDQIGQKITSKDLVAVLKELDETKAPSRGRYVAMIMHLLWLCSDAKMLHIAEKLLRLLDQVEGYSTIRGRSAWDGRPILTTEDAKEYLEAAHIDHQNGIIDSAGLRARIQVANACRELGLDVGPDDVTDDVDPESVVEMENVDAANELMRFIRYDRTNPN